MTQIRAIRGDITKINGIEGVVNAANSSLLGGGGVDGAIHKAAGPLLLFECMKLRGCKTGQAKITSAYNMNCDYIIHTVGPIWHGGKWNEDNLLVSCYRNSLTLARDNGIRSLAFPSVSTGVYRFPVKRAAEFAVGEVFRFVNENNGCFDLIEWVLFDDNTFQVYENELIKYS